MIRYYYRKGICVNWIKKEEVLGFIPDSIEWGSYQETDEEA